MDCIVHHAVGKRQFFVFFFQIIKRNISCKDVLIRLSVIKIKAIKLSFDIDFYRCLPSVCHIFFCH